MSNEEKERDVIEEMMKENTGRHFLDSGDHYGRNYEKNQDKDLKNLPQTKVEVRDNGNFWITVPLYHFLTAHLEFAPEMNEKFYKHVEELEDDNMSWLQCMKNFPEYREKFDNIKTAGLHGQDRPFTVNTYNHENVLSQTIQYHYWEETERNGYSKYKDAYVMLQIHGGCDVRGGYTKPKAFRVHDPALFMIGDSDVGAGCSNGHHWSSDDAGYHWHAANREHEDLHEKETMSVEQFKKLNKQVNFVFDDIPLVFDSEDNKLYCPECIQNMMDSGEGVDFIEDVELGFMGLTEF